MIEEENHRTRSTSLRTVTSTSALLDGVDTGFWSSADADTRFENLALVNAMVIKRRVRMSLACVDDPLPGQAPNVFLIFRERLALSSIAQFPPDGGATRGAARFIRSDPI